MKRKMIVLDLEDTLLSPDKTVSEENRRALGQMLAAGHLVSVATGRSLLGAKRIMREIGLDQPGCFLAAFQGSQLYDWGRDQVLFSDGIPGETAAELLKAFDEAGIHAHTFAEGELLSLHASEQLFRYNRIAKEEYRLLGGLEELKGKICQKVIAVDYDDHQRLEDFQRDYALRAAGKLVSFFSNRALLEYCKEGLDKGSGLVKLAGMLDIAIEDTVAVGDEENDIPMLRAAGVGAAMKNAIPAAKEAADYVTEHDCGHSGVAEVIRRFVL